MRRYTAIFVGPCDTAGPYDVGNATCLANALRNVRARLLRGGFHAWMSKTEDCILAGLPGSGRQPFRVFVSEQNPLSPGEVARLRDTLGGAGPLTALQFAAASAAGRRH